MASIAGRSSSILRGVKALPSRCLSRAWSSPSEVNMLITSTQG